MNRVRRQVEWRGDFGTAPTGERFMIDRRVSPARYIAMVFQQRGKVWLDLPEEFLLETTTHAQARRCCERYLEHLHNNGREHPTVAEEREVNEAMQRATHRLALIAEDHTRVPASPQMIEAMRVVVAEIRDETARKVRAEMMRNR